MQVGSTQMVSKTSVSLSVPRHGGSQGDSYTEDFAGGNHVPRENRPNLYRTFYAVS